MNITLRKATVEDIELLEYWDTKPHVIASGGADDDWNWREEVPKDRDWCEHIIAELDGRPIGFMFLMDPARDETNYWGDVPENLRAIDIWIGEENDLGKGYGEEMMRLAFLKCFAPPEVSAILIDPLASNERAHKFYERIGFEFFDYRELDGDLCKIYELTRQRWEEIY